MNEIFIKSIHIKKVRHLKNIDILLGSEKKHLILTGKNGSGKTSILMVLDQYFKDIFQVIQSTKKSLDFPYNCYPLFNNEEFVLKLKEEDFIYAFFRDKRRKVPMIESKGAKKIKLSKNKTAKLNDYFLQYLVNLNIDLLFAKVDNEDKKIEILKKWFTQFENMMKQIFDDSFKISLDRTDYTFWIERDNREPFTFNTLSAGYASIMDIVSEILMKIETTKSKSFNVEGIVLIDEVDNHLHVEMQKNILPLLTSFFPNIQFIVTTHSPFVLSSIENSVIYDLERDETIDSERVRNASYSQIVKNYFEIDSEFSQILEADIQRYEVLINLFEAENISLNDEKELLALDTQLDEIGLMLSSNIYLRFKALQKRIRE